jgi:hypothetical protein
MRYFYAWAPLVIAGAVVLLALPWLAVIALFVFAFVAIVAIAVLAYWTLAAPYLVGRSVYRRLFEPKAARARKPVGPGRFEEAGIR